MKNEVAVSETERRALVDLRETNNGVRLDLPSVLPSIAQPCLVAPYIAGHQRYAYLGFRERVSIRQQFISSSENPSSNGVVIFDYDTSPLSRSRAVLPVQPGATSLNTKVPAHHTSC